MFWFEVPALKTFLNQTSLGRVRAANPLLELHCRCHCRGLFTEPCRRFHGFEWINLCLFNENIGKYASQFIVELLSLVSQGENDFKNRRFYLTMIVDDKTTRHTTDELPS